ncbi:MAG: hypothetical protein IKX55_07320 [Bacteroidaceae bacterium]|nr:hypothetical protein [Bacteroidaceae bacterium]
MALRTNIHNNHDLFKTVALAVAALVLFSCQNEDALDNSGKVTIYPVISRSIETTIQTRALTGFTYSEFTDGKQALSANAVAFNSQTDARVTDQDKQGLFAPLTEGWRSTIEVEPSYKYNLYAYSRNMPSTSTTFNFGSESNVSLTFNGLSIMTEIDPLVGVAAAAASLPDGNEPPANYPELTKGSFSLGTIPATESGSTFKAFLALDHLYSKATISFCIDQTYNSLRQVRIKDVQIKLDKGTLTGNHTYTFYDQQLRLASDRTFGGSAMSIDLYDGDNATATPNEGDEFIALTTSLREFGYYYFLPLDPTPAMYLEVTYDIYDLNNNPVRQNQKATNSNLFAAISYNGGKAAAGNNYKLNILVSPTYLYQLSDDDLELGLTVLQQ